MAHNLTKVFLVLLMLQLTGSSSASRKLAFSMSYMNFTFGKKDIFSEFKYKYYNENRKVKIFVEFMLKENVTDYIAECSIDMIRGNNRPINFMKLPINACQLGKLIPKSSNSMLGVFIRELRRISNVPMRCPLSANKLYYFKNYTLNPDVFPHITLSMDWVLEAKIIVSKKHVGTLILHGRFYKI